MRRALAPTGDTIHEVPESADSKQCRTTYGASTGSYAMESREYNQARVGFVQAELGLARTFCHLAHSKDNASARLRCISNARTAYNAASRFMLKAEMSNAEFATFTANLEEVKFEVEALESQAR